MRIHTCVTVAISLWCTYCLLPGSVQGRTILFEEDFSNGLEKWELVRGVNSNWTIEQDVAKAQLNSPFSLTELVPKATHWNEDWQNIRYELDFTSLRGSDRNISFHFIDTNNWYEFHFSKFAYELVHVSNSQVVWSVTKPFIFQQNKQYHLELRLQGSQIQLFIDGLQITSEVDPTFTGRHGRIGLKAGTGADAPTEILIDNVVITPYTSEDLGLIELHQTDPLWATDEYDSAHAWATQTGIDAWGCALTSLVMIFNHYGVSRLPDETILTPGSLNHWLQNQPDGYVGEGLVSWSAALRVAQASHNRYGTPLLAYQKVVENIDATIEAELTAHRPFILQLPGHFVVGQGLVSTEPFDVRIADPLGQITQLSQQTHQPLSVRTFVPTTTPNPLILSISDQDTSVRFTDESGNNAGVTSIDFISSNTDSTPHTSTPQSVTELIPLNSQYSLQLAKPVFGYTATSLFGYDSNSLLTTQQLIQHVVGPLGIRFLLTYPVGDNQMTIKSLANFEELMLDLEPLSQDTQLSPPLKWALQELFSVASNQQNKSRYVSLTEQFLSERPVGTTSLGLEYLHQQLLAIEQY